MFKNMKVKKSLFLGFGIVIIIAVILVVICLAMMVNQRSKYEVLLNEDITANEEILYARINSIMAGRNIRDALLIPNSSSNDSLISTAEDCLDELEEHLSALEAAYPNQLDKTLLNEYLDATRTWSAGAPSLIQNYKSYKSTGDTAYLDTAKNFIQNTDTPNQDAMAAAATALDNYLVEGMDAERSSIEKTVVVTIIIIVVLMIVATIFVITLVLILIKSITDPTHEVHEALLGFSKGKLDIPVRYESRNELGEMCDALRASQKILDGVIREESYLLDEMAQGNFDLRFKDASIYVGALDSIRASITTINHNLSDTMTQITMSADQVAAGSEQVSTGAQALAQGATEQASAVEELSATIQEISHHSQENAKRSAEAMERAGYTGQQVDESAQNMDEMVRAMNRINASSEEIAKIIDTIENIAFQTNILALNAAVEAARAGSAGKGFAVVADEVRNLASKSDQAAKATKDLIDNSITAVKDGTDIMERVSASLQRTVDATNELKASIDEIATAVEKEAESITQVTEGIDQISSVVQTNSATSEESAATSEELSSQANVMKTMLAHFQLRSDAGDYGSSASYNRSAAAGAEDEVAAASASYNKY